MEKQDEKPTFTSIVAVLSLTLILHLILVESWTEQHQCSVKKLLEEYQHLFALNLKELGKTSLVQHEIRLSNNTPFKERYRRIPPHQYEELENIFKKC